MRQKCLLICVKGGKEKEKEERVRGKIIQMSSLNLGTWSIEDAP